MTDPRNTPLHIVAPYRTRITEREHFADIIVNNDGNRLICFWIVQRFGSPDVLTWGQERSFKAAQHAALQWVADTGNRRRVSKILGHVTESGMFFAGHALRLSIAARAALLIDDLYVEKP